MFTQSVLLSVLVALAEARYVYFCCRAWAVANAGRFGQEQIPIAAISSAPGGSSGQAQTLAGQSISTLLGAANPCAKVCSQSPV
jgi:hypothetical protein